jgi:hypothetical protein
MQPSVPVPSLPGHLVTLTLLLLLLLLLLGPLLQLQTLALLLPHCQRPLLLLLPDCHL